MEQFNIYQSANSNKESIKKSFIVRKTEFQTIIGTLSQHSSKDPVQHELILGRRGSGKTTLIKRIEIEIEEKLNEKYIPIHLAEEQASIYRLFDLWMEIIEELKRRFYFQTDMKSYSEFSKEQDYAGYLHQQIHEYCLVQQKQIVVFLDNFDRIVENITGEFNLLKDILINHNDLIIIAASTRMDEHFWQQDKLFYKFFRLHHLEALTIDEMKALLNHWAENINSPELKEFIANNPGKLQSIRIITDALPRTLHFFMLLIVQNNYSVENVDYIKEIIDYVTPLYQERLNNLPPQLRKTILEMALLWEACNTKEMVEKCRMGSKLISANLKTLADKGIVDKIETDKRNLLYRISERFFNTWIIMTQGNHEQKRKAGGLNTFLENWYNSSVFDIRNNKNTIELVNAPKDKDDRLILYDLGSIDRVQAIYSEAEKYYLKAIEKGQVGALFNLGNLYVNQEKFAEAEKYYLLAIEKGHISAMCNVGLLYFNQNKLSDAEKYYLLAIEKGDVTAMYNLGLLYAGQGKFADAENCYLLAIEKGDVSAIYNLANLYVSLGKFAEAEKYYLLAIEKRHISAMYNLGNLYVNQGNFAEAEKYYLLAIEKKHVSAMYNLGNLYAHQSKFAEAEKYYLLAIERGYDDAICNLAISYDNQGKYTEAEKYYLLAIEKNHTDAYRNLVAIYYRLNNKPNALKYIQQYRENEDFQIIIEIWNGIFTDVEERSLKIIKEEPQTLKSFIINLLIHQQKTLVLDLFNHPETGKTLQNEMKALHYVCLLLNKKTENNLILRIPPEIQTTINEIIRYIEEKEKFYGYRK